MTKLMKPSSVHKQLLNYCICWFNFSSLGRILIGRKEFEQFADLFKIVALFIAVPSQLVKGFLLCENLFSLVCTC